MSGKLAERTLPPLPPSPTSVGARRKGPKALPTLPLSAFTPPNTGTNDQFPVPVSPSALHPFKVVDAHVILGGGGLGGWKDEMKKAKGLDEKLAGVVVSLSGVEGEVEKLIKQLSSSPSTPPILAIQVPFNLYDGIPSNPPSYLSPPSSAPSSSSTSTPQIVLSSTYTHSTPQAIESLKWALTQGFNIDLDLQSNLRDDTDREWESLEDFFSQAIPPNTESKGNLILSNILPPPDDFQLPIVKLINHPTYRSYQSRTASLSLYSPIYIKFIPPTWGIATPPTPAPPSSGTTEEVTTPTVDSGVDLGEGGGQGQAQVIDRDTLEKKEWKRRIKMYIGPSLEAFGYQRIIYGSSPSPLSHSQSNAGDWYELARESFAELAVEQDMLDAIFAVNAVKAYSAKVESA